jgi:hypothetical protein
MAKKSTRREPDPDLEDDEDDVELDEAPPKKKGSARLDKSSKTSATGKRKSTDSAKTTSSAKSKALKDSGKRKSAARDDDDEAEPELTGSARRRRPLPVKKKNDQQMIVIGVSIISIALLMAIGIVIFNKKRTPLPQRDENKEYSDFKVVWDEGMNAFREFNRAESQGNATLSRQKHGEAHQKLQRAMDMLEAILSSKRNAAGDLPKEFEGYESDMQKIAEILVDLEKRGTVDSSAGSH